MWVSCSAFSALRGRAEYECPFPQPAVRRRLLCRRSLDHGHRARSPVVDSVVTSRDAGDPILTPERLAERVAAGQVRFVMVEDAARLRRRFGLDPGGQTVADWVRGKGRLVDPDLWRQPGEPPAGDAAAPRRGLGRGAAGA